jgi:hypothetical protein
VEYAWISCDRGVAAATGSSQLRWGCRSCNGGVADGDRGVARLPEGAGLELRWGRRDTAENPIGIPDWGCRGVVPVVGVLGGGVVPGPGH